MQVVIGPLPCCVDAPIVVEPRSMRGHILDIHDLGQVMLTQLS